MSPARRGHICAELPSPLPAALAISAGCASVSARHARNADPLRPLLHSQPLLRELG